MKEVKELFEWMMSERLTKWQVFHSSNGVVAISVYCMTQDECFKCQSRGLEFASFNKEHNSVTFTKYIKL